MDGFDWNSTDVEDVVFLRDNSITTAVVGKTGIVASNITARYFKPGMTAQGTLAMTALGSLGAVHADGGFLEINNTGMPGHYRLCLSDTMAASVAGANPYLDLCLTGTGFDAVNKRWNLLQPLSAATFGANVQFINGTTAVGASGYFGADIIRAGGTAAPSTAGYLDVNAQRLVGTTAAATAGRIDANMVLIGGTTAVATAGVVDARAITLGTSAQSAIRTEVNQSVDTIINTTARATPTAAAPPINAALGVKLDWMYERAVSRLITGATSVIQHNGSNVAIATATLAGDTATDTRNRFA